MSRRAIVFGSAALLLLAIVVSSLLLIRWLDDGARTRLEAILSEALDREVTIGALEIDAAAQAVELVDVVVGNPDGVSGAPILRAETMRFETSLQDLLARRVVGDVHVRGVQLRVVRFAEGTNLDGMLPTHPKPERPMPEVHLRIDVHEGRVLLEDLERDQTLAFEGVTIDALVSNRERTPAVESRFHIATLALHDVRLHGVEIEAHASEHGVRVPALSARVGERGRLKGSGRLDMRRGNLWSFELEARHVALDEEVAHLVRHFVPLVTTATGTSARPMRGKVDVDVALSGQGLAWDTIAGTLDGQGQLVLRQVVIANDAPLVSLAALAGRAPEPWTLEQASAAFALKDGWIELSRLEVDDEALRLPVSGRVSFAGELDLAVDLMPLVELFGGGVYEQVAQYTTTIPVRIGGTVDAPALRPPTLGEVVRSLSGGVLRRHDP